MGRLRRTARHGLKQRRWIVNRVCLVNMVVLEKSRGIFDNRFGFRFRVKGRWHQRMENRPKQMNGVGPPRMHESSLALIAIGYRL